MRERALVFGVQFKTERGGGVFSFGFAGDCVGDRKINIVSSASALHGRGAVASRQKRERERERKNRNGTERHNREQSASSLISSLCCSTIREKRERKVESCGVFLCRIFQWLGTGPGLLSCIFSLSLYYLLNERKRESRRPMAQQCMLCFPSKACFDVERRETGAQKSPDVTPHPINSDRLTTDQR